MGNSIPLSPKHGVNPCMPVCAFCGEDTGEIALLGKLKGDAEAPMRAIINWNPCKKCQENWSKGAALLRVTNTPPPGDPPPMTEKEGVPIYPTGQYAVITTETAERIFELKEPLKKGIPLLVDAEVFDDIMERMGGPQKED